MSEIFIIKNTGKGIINSLAPENVVPIKSAGSSDGGVITEDSDTVAFTGNGTALEPLVAEVKSDGLDFIPLGGTIEGKPITGNLTFKIEDTKDGESIENIGGIYNVDQRSVSVVVANMELGIGTGISSYYNAIEIFKMVEGVSKMSFMFSDSGITLYDRLFQKGLVAEAYYGANYDDNTYVQKKYVDDPETLITVLNNANSTQLATIKGLLGIV